MKVKRRNEPSQRIPYEVYVNGLDGAKSKKKTTMKQKRPVENVREQSLKPHTFEIRRDVNGGGKQKALQGDL